MEIPDQKYPSPQSIDSSPSSSGKKSILDQSTQTNRKFIAILVVFAILAVGSILLFVSWRIRSLGINLNPIKYAQCSQLEQEIDTLIQQANYCEVDEDCVVNEEAAHLGLCFNLVNKDADVASTQAKRLQWQNLDCGKGIGNKLNK